MIGKLVPTLGSRLGLAGAVRPFAGLSRSFARPAAPFVGAARLHTSRPALQAKPSVHNVEDLVRYKTEYVRPEAASVAPLKEAPALYARIHVHNWDMLVTPGDVIKLPVRMRDVEIGNTLRFSECSEIGSRSHTLSGGHLGKGRIDPSIFTIRGTVLEKSRVKRSVAERTRRRRRHVRHVVSNQCLTVIRIGEITLN